MKSSKSKKRGRIIALTMAIMTVVPVGFSVAQGVSIYRNTQQPIEQTTPAEIREPVTSIMDVQEIEEEISIQ